MNACAKIVAAAAALLLPACHDDGLDEHGCVLDYSGGWGDYGLSVEHQEPTRCPVFIQEPGTMLRTAWRAETRSTCASTFETHAARWIRIAGACW